MTGVGKAIARYDNKNIVVFIKTLNSKQLDISTRIASIYREQEIGLRSLVAESLVRGKVELSISVEEDGGALSGVQQINERALRHYLESLTPIYRSLSLELPSSESLLRLPGVLTPNETGQIEKLPEAEWQVLKGAVQEALEAVVAFRRQEGIMLYEALVQRIRNIQELLLKVDQPEVERLEMIRERITEALEKFLPDDYNQGRLEQEMIYYIEKLDINEEKDRLRHHLGYFLEAMEQEAGQGKTLGFIAQEIGREINTLGSKSNHAQMQQIVVKMKDELEQIKEQSLNVL